MGKENLREEGGGGGGGEVEGKGNEPAGMTFNLESFA